MTGTELVAVATADEIATLPAEDRAVMVTHALHESKQWLAVATKGTDPTPIVEFKAWAATVAEMTKQKRLAGEIQADALEMLRRAERGIGQAVRNGQEAGEIATRGGLGPVHTPGLRGSSPRSDTDRSDAPASPKEFLTNGQEAHEVYSMTDNVTDEEFDAALTEAREEGNLSRANVVRKIRKESGPATRDQRADLIAELALTGMTSRQMVARVGVSDESVRKIARDYDIDIPADRVVGRTRRLDHTQMVESTVTALENTCDALTLIDFSEVDAGEVDDWVTSLSTSIRRLNRFKQDLKEMTHV